MSEHTRLANKLEDLCSLLSGYGCDCECGHSHDEHDYGCDRCFTCQVGDVLGSMANVRRDAALIARAPELEEVVGRLRDVVDAARKIRHWHDSGRDNEGMVVSANSVRGLWAALQALAPKPAPKCRECDGRGEIQIVGTYYNDGQTRAPCPSCAKPEEARG